MPTRLRISHGVASLTALVLVVTTAGVFAQQMPPQRPPATNLPAGSPLMPRIEGATPPRPDTGQPLNVKVDVTIADQTGTTPGFKKTMSVTVADRARSSIRSRIDVPVPSTTFTPMAGAQAAGTDKEKAAPISPMVSYSYRSLGLNLDVSEIAIEANFVRLRLTIEYSPLDEKLAEGDAKATLPPGIANFQQTLSLILENGKPLVVAQTSDPVPSRDRKQTVEVKATILK